VCVCVCVCVLLTAEKVESVTAVLPCQLSAWKRCNSWRCNTSVLQCSMHKHWEIFPFKNLCAVWSCCRLSVCQI